MKKRKELDALVAHSCSGKRVVGCGGVASPQDQLLAESTDEQDDYWSGKDRGGNGSNGGGGAPRCRLFLRRRFLGSLLRACTAALVFACVVATTTVMWLFIDIREQVTSLRNKLDQGALRFILEVALNVSWSPRLTVCYVGLTFIPGVAHNIFQSLLHMLEIYLCV